MTDIPLTDVVAGARSGDHSAFTELYRRFESAVRATAFRVTRDPDDAADVAQQTWVTVVEKLPDLKAPECFPGWVITIARRHALHHVHCRSRLESTDPETLDRRLDLGETVEQSAEREDRADRVRRGMARLAPDRARILVELVCNGRAYDEVAAECNRPVGSLGPSRARYLDQLAQQPEIKALAAS